MTQRFCIVPAEAVYELNDVELQVLLCFGAQMEPRDIRARISISQEELDRALKALVTIGYLRVVRGEYRMIMDRGEPEARR